MNLHSLGRERWSKSLPLNCGRKQPPWKRNPPRKRDKFTSCVKYIVARPLAICPIRALVPPPTLWHFNRAGVGFPQRWVRSDAGRGRLGKPLSPCSLSGTARKGAISGRVGLSRDVKFRCRIPRVLVRAVNGLLWTTGQKRCKHRQRDCRRCARRPSNCHCQLHFGLEHSPRTR